MNFVKLCIIAAVSIGLSGCMSPTRTGAALEDVAAGSAMFKTKTATVNAPANVVEQRLSKFASDCLSNTGFDIVKFNKVSQTVLYDAKIEDVSGGKSLVLYMNMASGFAHASENTKGFNAYSSTRMIPNGATTTLVTTEAFGAVSRHDSIVANAAGQGTGCPDVTQIIPGL